jgi:hypothetical protein
MRIAPVSGPHLPETAWNTTMSKNMKATLLENALWLVF